MSSMAHRAEFLLCLLLLGAWACGALGRGTVRSRDHVRIENAGGNDIPQRCLEMTVSPLPCAGVGEDRLLPHPDDCELFYYCVDEVPICRQCPAGLHFSPSQHVCERAERAGCSAAPQPDRD